MKSNPNYDTDFRDHVRSPDKLMASNFVKFMPPMIVGRFDSEFSIRIKLPNRLIISGGIRFTTTGSRGLSLTVQKVGSQKTQILPDLVG